MNDLFLGDFAVWMVKEFGFVVFAPRRSFLRGFLYGEVAGLNDEVYMREALRLALNGRGRTSPNPMVGAVLVKDGRIVGMGWHRKAGTEHAAKLGAANRAEAVGIALRKHLLKM